MMIRCRVWPGAGTAKVEERRQFEDEMDLVQRESEFGKAVALV